MPRYRGLTGFVVLREAELETPSLPPMIDICRRETLVEVEAEVIDIDARL